MDVKHKFKKNKKTRLWFFRDAQGSALNVDFFLGNQMIDVVQDYTYLGTLISSSGNFSVTLDLIYNRESTSYPFQSETTHGF